MLRHHTDLHLQNFSIVVFRVAVALVKLDVKHNRARYVDNTPAELMALRERLNASGMNTLGNQISAIHMLHLAGVKLNDMYGYIFGNSYPPYSKYGGRAGVPVRKSSGKAPKYPTFQQHVLPMGDECLDN